MNRVASGKDKNVVYDGAEGGITIMSYDLALRMSDELSTIRYGVVICDESHTLKNGDSKKSKVGGKGGAVRDGERQGRGGKG